MVDRKFIITNNQSGQRLDMFLAAQLRGINSRTKIKNLILDGKVMVNNRKTSPHYILKDHDRVNFDYSNSAEKMTMAQEIPLNIIYEDCDIIVVNKPAGLVVHPGAGNKINTLVNALYFYTKGCLSYRGGKYRAGIVHRLDKDTSGLIVAAKNDSAHIYLSEQFKKHMINKVYFVIVKGIVQHDQGKCDQSIGRGRIFRKKMIVQAVEGKPALTEYTVIKRYTNATFLKVKIHTGRTHQIRVHMAFLGYPVLGDRHYGVISSLIVRQCIHAGFLEMHHPRTRKKIRFEAPLPENMKYVLNVLESQM